MVKRIILSVVVLFSAISAISAQSWLQKLEKAAKKANETLENVSNTIDEVNKTIERPDSKEKQRNEPSNSQTTSPAKETQDELKPVKLTFPEYPGPAITASVLQAYIPERAKVLYPIGDDMICVNYGNYYGYFNTNGEPVFNYEWELAGKFENGACINKKNNQWVILYKDGTYIEIPGQYGAIRGFTDGVAVASRIIKEPGNSGSRILYLNIGGEEIYKNIAFSSNSIYPPGLTAIQPLSEGLRAYYDYEKKRWGYIDAGGKIIIPARFREALPFSEGLAAVDIPTEGNNKGLWGFIDKTGKTVIPPTYSAAPSRFGNGLCAVKVFNEEFRYGAYYYIDRTGEQKSGPYTVATPFTDGYAMVSDARYGVADYYMIIDTDFSPVAPTPTFEPDKPPVFYDGWAKTKKGGHTGYFIEPDGTIVLGEKNINDWIDHFYHTDLAYCRAEINRKSYVGAIGKDGVFKLIFSNSATKKEAPPAQNITVHPKYGLTLLVELDNKPENQSAATVSPAKGLYKAGSIIPISTRPSDQKKYRFFGWKRSGRIISPEREFSYTTRAQPDTLIAIYKAKIMPDPKFPIISNQTDSCNIEYYAAPYRLTDTNGVTEIDGTMHLVLAPCHNSKTPYGDNQGGYLTFETDPEAYVEASMTMGCQKIGNAYAKVFFFPFNVIGTLHENGKDYLLLNGGGGAVGKIKAQTDPWTDFLLQMALNSHKEVVSLTTNYLYRLEVKWNTDGTITLGELRCHDYLAGWLDPDDSTFKRTRNYGLWKETIGSGMSVEFAKGCILKQTGEVPDILWGPPASWYHDHPFEEAYRQIIDSMRNSMNASELQWFEAECDCP